MKTLTTQNDQELIQLFIAGNAEAFSTLVQRHKNKIYSTIYFLIKDKYLAEDFFQDTFVKIIDTIKAGKYTDEGKFLPWALRIAHNLCLDHFRKVKRSPAIKTSDDRNIFDTIHFSETGADEIIAKGERNATVRKMLDLLPEDQREIIVLRHYADLSFKEVAALTNCSINTALGRMRYALINLRKMMKENEMAL
ncbi:MAG TPA: sigma-70 family RNA polymerase sigma factor [Ferruginibacter sp.]|nr:sigma-70 family RNA polymerase sigma factor [Ferruginibacter sp.]